MLIHRTNLAGLETVAQGLGDWLSKTAFIGGQVLEVYRTDPVAASIRPSREVDCLVSMPGMGFMPEWEKYLQERGFSRHDMASELALEWSCQGVEVRLVPLWSEGAGFENKWLEEGLFHARSFTLESGVNIRVFTPVYFVAAKLEALLHRGWYDLRSSEDFEDLVFLLEARPELPDELGAAFYEVRDYVRGVFGQLLYHPELEEALYGMLPLNSGATRISRIQAKMESMSYSKISSLA